MNTSPTGPRPPLDLDHALRTIADAVTPGTSDAVAARRVVAGVRRARRRRGLLAGATALLVAAGIGVGTSAVVADDPRPLVPAPAPSEPVTPGPAPTHRTAFPPPTTADALGCGAPAPRPTGPGALASVSVGAADVTVAAGEVTDVPGRVVVDGDARLSVQDPSSLAGWVLVQDDVVVAASHPLRDRTGTVDLAEGSETALTVTVGQFGVCAPDDVTSGTPSLAPGEYELSLVVPWVVDSYALRRDGSWGATVEGAPGGPPPFDGWLVSEPVPFVVEPAPEPVTEPDDRQTAAASDALPGAFAGPTTTFPAPQTFASLECGMPAPTPTGDTLLARLVAPPSVGTDAGTSAAVPATLVGHPHARTSTVDFLWLGATVVVQDGRIVSSTRVATDSDGSLALDAGQAVALEYTVGPGTACDGGTPTGADLAPGEYSVHVVLPWIVTSYALQQRDGTWAPERTSAGGAAFSGWLVSEPVALTVG